MNELMEKRGEPELFMRVCHNPTLTDEQIRGVFAYLVKAKRKKWAQEEIGLTPIREYKSEAYSQHINLNEQRKMSNAEQVSYQSMLRQCEKGLFADDTQDDVSDWIDAKSEQPIKGKMVWAACPNAVLCYHQTFLLYMDSDCQWRDNTGCLFSRKVNFWQYAEVPVFEGSC